MIEALNNHSFDSEPGSVGVTGQTTDSIISIGVTLAGTVPVGGDMASAMARNITHCHPASRSSQR